MLTAHLLGWSESYDSTPAHIGALSDGLEMPQPILRHEAPTEIHMCNSSSYSNAYIILTSYFVCQVVCQLPSAI